MKKILINMRPLIIFKLVAIASVLTLISGCKKTFDIEPKDQLNVTQAYQNVYDADAAVVGIYGKFMKLADRYTVSGRQYYLGARYKF